MQEKPRGQFKAVGLIDAEKLRKALWDNLHNRKQVSANLLSEADVQPMRVDGLTVLQVRVSRAGRQQRPVHVGANPFGGTWLRRYEGDYAADDEAVRRMLAERVEDSRDERVLKGFDFADLDMESVAAYRNRFAAVRPGHVWTELPVPEFLERIGAWGKNREESHAGLRVAGLLMFGRAEVIRDALPHYMVDYQGAPASQDRTPMDRPAGTGRHVVGQSLRFLPTRLSEAHGRPQGAVPAAGRPAGRRHAGARSTARSVGQHACSMPTIRAVFPSWW